MSAKTGWLGRLAAGLKRSSARLGDGITGILARRRLDEAALAALEDLLISAEEEGGRKGFGILAFTSVLSAFWSGSALAYISGYVGARGLHDLLRRDHVSHGLRHLLPLLVEDEAVRQHDVEGRAPARPA